MSLKFLQEINSQKDHQKKSKGSGIKYQEYDVLVDGSETKVYIPLRESDNFESEVSGYQRLTHTDLRGILRKFRGVRNIK